MDQLVVTQILNIAFGIATLAVLALGLAIVFGLLGVLNIAHGELIMLGAYSAWVAQSAGIAVRVRRFRSPSSPAACSGGRSRRA